MTQAYNPEGPRSSSGAHSPTFPQTLSGALYPRNYVVAVIDNLEEAQQAVLALQDAGYRTNAIRLMDAHEAQQKIQELEGRRNWLQRFLSSFQDTTDETGALVYKFEAKKGHNLLNVRADSPRDVEKIRDILGSYQAHTMKFFGTWSVEDIPPRHILSRQNQVH